MGTYPERTIVEVRRLPDGGEVWEELERTPGLVRARTVQAGPWFVKKRTNCFCCSCDQDEDGYIHHDFYCRNHGFAGLRPCEEHQMPGQKNEDGYMPSTVQAVRAGQQALRGGS